MEERCIYFGRVRYLIYIFVLYVFWRFEKDKIFLYICVKIEFEEVKIYFMYLFWRLKYINV